MPDSVMVFAPSPQLTVTIERNGDDDEIHLHAGGQGVWVARMINSLGVPVRLVSAFGNETGNVVRTLIGAEGLPLAATDTTGGNGAYVHDRRDGPRTELAQAPGHTLTRHEQDELYGLALAEGLQARVAVLTGVADPRVLPPDTYRRLAADLRRNGTTVIADLSGDYLDAALAGTLDVLKVSHEELLNDGRSPDDDTTSLVTAMRRLQTDGAANIIVSRAEKPALTLLDQQILQIQLPQLEPADHRGAGDSMTAGIAAVLAQGGDLPTAVRTGAAAGALNVTRHGLGTGRADTITRLLDSVQLTAPPDQPGAQHPESGHTTPQELAGKVRHP
ncbi:1-phosphofructokinase [Catellatospora sp. TT07R-123]|uniref:1-phosphofructokinase family hexose kinase n=1 Tax=Catellatospora sp. TT07R-123 TaxID=2733863 RepID=UPI001B10FA23|nr:PfkB family carbohydrate kinase [Catellatospora sp. TT07R-123]GHJ42665.1 1-phosphofructokinase [Catellatospora sp. TT07R-123]